MEKKFLNGMAVLTGVLTSSLALAEDMAAAPTSSYKWAAALAIGLGAFGAAFGQGLASSKALEGIARNPTSRGDVFVPLIIALAFMEFQALLAFIIAFMLVG